MRLYIILIVFSTLYNLANCQTIQEIEFKIDSLNKEKSNLNSELKRVTSELSQFEQQRLRLINKEKFSDGYTISTHRETFLYENRGTWYKKLAKIPSSTTLLAYDLKSNYYFVEYDTLNGFVISSDVETIDQKNKKLEKEKIRKQAQAEVQSQLINKYGSTNGKRIYEGKIWLGMSKEMVLDSWGKPEGINRSVGSWGVHEQWIYGRQYLYFRNDKLNSWQDHN